MIARPQMIERPQAIGRPQMIARPQMIGRPQAIGRLWIPVSSPEGGCTPCRNLTIASQQQLDCCIVHAGRALSTNRPEGADTDWRFMHVERALSTNRPSEAARLGI
ncbi:MAG: hypothetical protein KJP18_05675 [Gemmatimonadetes bacterium]|nr:hypothetical protein [Gemmatimonadota bacterium]